MRSVSSSVQFLLTALFGLMATGLVGGLWPVDELGLAATRDRAAQNGSRQPITRHLFLAMQNMRIERGTVSAALIEKEPIDAATWKDIQNLRARSTPALAEAFDMLLRFDFNDRDRWVCRTTIKKRFPSRLCAPMPTKFSATAVLKTNAEFNDKWVAAVGTLVERMDALLRGLSSEVRLNDPFFDQMLTVKDLAWNVRSRCGHRTLDDRRCARGWREGVRRLAAKNNRAPPTCEHHVGLVA